VPVTIVTGFLGAGKTTILNRLLRDPALSQAVVMINEFGEIGLDHLFVERIDGDMVMMASGCLCCTIRGELVDAMEDLLRRRDNGRIRNFDRVIIETTGLADPAPVLHTIMSHPYLLLRFRLDGVVAVVDAVNGASTLAEFPEALKQAAVADRLVLTKADLVDAPEQVAQLREQLKRLNPTAFILDAASDEIDSRHLLDAGLYNPLTKEPDVQRWLNAEKLMDESARANSASLALHSQHHHGHVHDVNRHNASIRAFCLVNETALSISACDLFLQLLRSAHGPGLLRVKGIVALADDLSRPLVIHGVQHVYHPPVRLEAWPDDDHRTRIVFIVKDVKTEFIEGLYAAFAGQIVIDAPDKEALTDNPLKSNFGGLLS
jgi:G3E family GTPase